MFLDIASLDDYYLSKLMCELPVVNFIFKDIFVTLI